MSKIDLYDPKWVELVFAGKNKEYGAYKLRKNISQRNIKALTILLVVAFLGGGYLAYQIKKHNDELAAQEAYAAKMELKALQDAKKEQEKRKAQQKKVAPKKVEPEKVVPVTRATCKFTAPVIKDDKDVKEEMPPMFKMNNTNKAVGIEDKDGVNDRSTVASRSTVATPQEIIPKIEKPAVEAPKVEAPAEDIDKKIFTSAQQDPAFKNGNVHQWISDHLHYPDIAVEQGIQGQVVVKFVVSRDGSITQAFVARSLDPLLDKEALRVVNSMPKWAPGMNNGQPVNVWYTLPIRFKLN